MNILVTGGAGYIGSHVCKLLAAKGHVPIAYDNLSRGHRGAVKWGPLEVGDTGDAVRLHAVLERYQPRAVPGSRVHVIANWADDEQISPVARTDNRLRQEWELQDKFVVGYSGNLGRAHEFSTLLGAAERLRGDPRIAFIFIGGGRQFDALACEVTARRLERSVRFFPYQERAALKYSLSAPDVHWMSLRPELESLLFPSKLYGILAAGRPVIVVAAKRGEIATLVEAHGCGIGIEPGEAEALAAAISDLSRNPARCDDMGRRSRALLDQKFSRRAAFEQWDALIEKVLRVS